MQINKIQNQNFGATIEQTQALKDLLKMSTKHSHYTSVAKDFNKIHRFLPLDTDKVIFKKFKEVEKEKNGIFTKKTYQISGEIISNGKSESFTHKINETGRSNYDAIERAELLCTLFDTAKKIHQKAPYAQEDIALFAITNNTKVDI